MTILDERDFDYPHTVTVSRQEESRTENGDYIEICEPVITGMTADIQLSLKVRNLISEDSTGVSGQAVWLMFCKPPEEIRAGDRVNDADGRVFIVDAVGDWGSHVECILSPV